MKMHHGLLDRRDGRRRSQGIVGFGNLRTGPAESAQDAGSEGERDRSEQREWEPALTAGHRGFRQRNPVHRT